MYFLKRQLKKAHRAAAPDRDFERALRARLLQAYSAQYGGSVTATPRVWFPRFVTVGVTSFVLIFGMGTGVYAYNSPEVVEGNALYFVKQGIENIEGRLAFSSEARAQFHLKMSQRRLAEAEQHADKSFFTNLLQSASVELGLSTEELKDQLKDPATRESVLQELGETNQRYANLLQRVPQGRAGAEIRIESPESSQDEESGAEDGDQQTNRLPPQRMRAPIPPELRGDVKILLQKLQESGMTPEEQRKTFTTELHLLLEEQEQEVEVDDASN